MCVLFCDAAALGRCAGYGHERKKEYRKLNIFQGFQKYQNIFL
jgi:hypothetical protein